MCHEIRNSFIGSAGTSPSHPSRHLKPTSELERTFSGWHSISSSQVLPVRGDPKIQTSFDSSSSSSNGRPALAEQLGVGPVVTSPRSGTVESHLPFIPAFGARSTSALREKQKRRLGGVHFRSGRSRRFFCLCQRGDEQGWIVSGR